MGQKDGSVESLVRGFEARNQNLDNKICDDFLFDMLQALEYLDSKGVIHRDVKPANILYVKTGSNYSFQLGDFGLANHKICATTANVGSQVYHAPELHFHNRQSTKGDIWALFVTMMWLLDLDNFRPRCNVGFNSMEEIFNLVACARQTHVMRYIAEMADPEPRQRASAAQMFDQLNNVLPPNERRVRL